MLQQKYIRKFHSVPYMKKSLIFLFLFFSIVILSCEPEDTPPSPVIPEVEPPSPTTPDPISVLEVLPTKNDIGDTITITGKNFSRSLLLSLNEKRIQPILLNDTIIKFRIPFGNYDPFDFQLQLKDEDEEITLRNPYELYAPVIDSIPGLFGFDERVVLYGKHLTNPSGQQYNILFLDDLEIPVVSHSRDSIVFDLPWEVQEYQYDVLVKAQLQETRKAGGLNIQSPSFEASSNTSVEIGEIITLYGSYFYPHRPNLHEVSFQGNRAEVLEAYRDSLKVRIPMGPYKTRKIDELKIKLFEKETLFPVDMDIISTWYMYGYKRDGDITGGSASVGTVTRWSFKANDAFYFNVFRDNGNYSPINNILYKYTPETDHWEEINLPIRSELMDFGEVLEFYPQEGTNSVYIYIQRKTENFFKFNVVTRELVPLRDFPTEAILHYGTGFHLNENFYYGLGYTEDPTRIKNQMFWRYNEDADTWTEIGAMPDVHDEYPRFGASIFRTNNSVFIGNGHEYAYDLWEFSSNETWTRRSDISNPVSEAISVQKGQKGFYYNYLYQDFWEYDISLDKFTRREDLKIGYYATGHQTMFIHGDYVYYVGYLQDYGPDGTPYFRHDHAILRTELSNF